MSNHGSEPSDLIPDDFELGAVGSDDLSQSDAFDTLESELIALVDTLGEELQVLNSPIPETWQLAETSPRLYGRPFRYAEFQEVVMPLNTKHLQVKILNG